jgi:hypothetical protein
MRHYVPYRHATESVLFRQVNLQSCPNIHNYDVVARQYILLRNSNVLVRVCVHSTPIFMYVSVSVSLSVHVHVSMSVSLSASKSVTKAMTVPVSLSVFVLVSVSMLSMGWTFRIDCQDMDIGLKTTSRYRARSALVVKLGVLVHYKWIIQISAPVQWICSGLYFDSTKLFYLSQYAKTGFGDEKDEGHLK